MTVFEVVGGILLMFTFGFVVGWKWKESEE